MGSTAHSRATPVFLLASLALAGAGAGAGAGASTRGTAPRFVKPSGPINLHASSTSFDLRTQHALLRKVVIVQGDLTVTADRAEATGLNFKNSRWTFSSNVHIDSAVEGKLSSDRATVEFRDERMQSAVVTGSPATFEQTSSTTGVLARGHADSIVYTIANSTVRLTGDAWLRYGDNEITGPVLVYDIKSQRLKGASTTERGERVHITILPRPGTAKNPTAQKGTAKTGAKPRAASPGETP
ncbi:MAG: lipopolysaccharide transport periplasmic protein LptA [Steroidobacteraceae bacterium]